MFQKVRDIKWADRSSEGVNASVKGPYFSWEHSREHYDGLSWARNSDNYPSIDLPNFNYYMTLGKLMEVIQTKIAPLIMKSNPEVQLDFDYQEESNICNSYPNLISFI